MEDYIVRSAIEGTQVIGFFARSTGLVEKAQAIHQTFPVATCALGRALTLVGIMGVSQKKVRRISLQIHCRGPLKEILVQSNQKGEVRGYVSQPMVILPPRKEGKINVEDGVGKGSQLLVMKDLGLKEPYLGSVEVQRGGIAYDLAYYFNRSEQLPSACSAGVYVAEGGEVLSAGGFIIHTPFGTPEEVITTLEQNLSRVGEVSKRLFQGETPEDLAEEVFASLPARVTGRESLQYHCYCSSDRARRALILLGKEELTKLLEEQGQGEVTCPFCNQKYLFDRRQLQEMILSAQDKSRRFKS